MTLLSVILLLSQASIIANNADAARTAPWNSHSVHRTVSCPVLLPVQPPYSARISGGSIVNKELRQYIINKTFFTFGANIYSVIGPRLLITAKSSAQHIPHSFTVSNRRDSLDYESAAVHVRRIVRHPDANNSSKTHFVLVELNETLPSYVGIFALPQNSSMPLERSVLRVISANGPESTYRRPLLQADLSVSPCSSCSFGGYSTQENFRKERFCTTNTLQPNCSISGDDETASIVQYSRNGTPILVGIVGPGNNSCADSTLHFRTAGIVDWIRNEGFSILPPGDPVQMDSSGRNLLQSSDASTGPLFQLSPSPSPTEKPFNEYNDDNSSLLYPIFIPVIIIPLCCIIGCIVWGCRRIDPLTQSTEKNDNIIADVPKLPDSLLDSTMDHCNSTKEGTEVEKGENNSTISPEGYISNEQEVCVTTNDKSTQNETLNTDKSPVTAHSIENPALLHINDENSGASNAPESNNIEQVDTLGFPVYNNEW